MPVLMAGMLLLAPFRTLSSSDCHPAGPAGPYVAGGPVGPDASFKLLEPLEHSVLDHADPAGQHAAVGTLSPSDCCPVGPAGPYVTGGPVGPDDFSVLITYIVYLYTKMLTYRGYYAFGSVAAITFDTCTQIKGISINRY